MNILLILATCLAIDGDTIRCGTETIRLARIDTPEIHGQCQAEREAAHRARVFLQSQLDLGPVEIVRSGRDRYGRTLAEVYGGRPHFNLSTLMIDMQLARRWSGRRRPWCPAKP